MNTIILASSSAGRREILERARLRFEVQPSSVDEEAAYADFAAQNGELTPAAKAQFLATLKAQDVAASSTNVGLVLGCDSIFALESDPDIALEKPIHPEIALERMSKMRGQWGVLHTGHTLIDTTPTTENKAPENRTVERTISTRVKIGDFTDEEARLYVQTGEPLFVAGGLCVEAIGSVFIEAFEGDYLSVMGLSPFTLRQMLHHLSHRWPDFLQAPPTS